MLKWHLLRSIERDEWQLGQSLEYARHIARTSGRAFVQFSKLLAVARYHHALPLEAGHVARIVAALGEDCGPSVQISINAAANDGMPSATLQAVLEGRPEDLSDHLAWVYHFAQAIVSLTGEEQIYRDKLRQLYGEEGIIELGLAIASARALPTVKRAMGYAKSCAETRISTDPVTGGRRARARLDQYQHAPDLFQRIYSAPRRFDLATIFAVSVGYSLLLTGLRLLNAPANVLAFAAGLVTCVGAAQALLFGGNKPRASSLITGAAYTAAWSLVELPRFTLSTGFICPAVTGLLLGYLAGTLVGGVFLVADYLRSGKDAADLPE